MFELFFVGHLAEDKNGNIWICTEGGGLNLWTVKRVHSNILLRDLLIRSYRII